MMLICKNTKIFQKTYRQFLASFCCNLAGFLSGINTTWLAPISLWLTSDQSEIKMSNKQFTWITAIIELGTVISVVPAGILADWYGRKLVLLLAAPLCFLSWILVASSRNITLLYVARFLQGIYIAVAHTVAPMYVAEITHPKLRGFLGSHFSLMLALGAVYSHVTGSHLQYQSYVYALMSPPIVFFMLLIFMPETPYYYFMVKNKTAATVSYYWLANHCYNLGEGSNSLKEIEQEVQKAVESKTGWKALIATKSDRKALLIVQTVSTAKWAIGLPIYLSYCREIFLEVSPSNELLSSDQLGIAMNVINAIGAFTSSLLLDTLGRRALIIWTAVGAALANFIIAVYFYLYKETRLNLTGTEWIVYLAVAIFCASISLGIVQVASVVQAEFFPSNTRAKGGAISGIVTALGSFIVLNLYPALSVAVGIYINYIIFSFFSLMTAAIIYVILPESARKTLAEVNASIKN